MSIPLAGPDTADALSRLAQANRQFAAAYPGDRGDRQPVHVVYGGGHLFTAGIARKLGRGKGKTYVTTGEAEEIYGLVCEEHGESPRAHTQFWKYLNQLRDGGFIVSRMSGKGQAGTTQLLSIPDAPAGVPQSFDEHIKLQFDLAALAYQAGLTRIVTFMMAAEISMLTYNQVGVSEAFHPLSHHQNNPYKMARLAVVQAYHSTVFARFLEKLKSTPDGDGSLLDHSLVLYGSGMSDGNQHNHTDLPIIIAGGASGRLKGGRHIRNPTKTPMANLLLAMLDKMQVPTEKFGDSTGRVDI